MIVEETKQSTVADAKLKELRAEHPGKRLFIVVGEYDEEEVEVVCRLPTTGEVQKAMKSAKAGAEIDALDELFRDCCLYPDPAFVLENQYGVVTQVASELFRRAGLGAKARSKKA